MGKEEQTVKDRLQKLIQEMEKRDCYTSGMITITKKVVDELQQKGVYCVDKFVHKLSDRVNDKEAYLDILMEGRFAIVLARNGFTEIYIEYHEPGADLKADYNGQTVYFEVTRRRPNEEDERLRQSKDPIWISATKAEIIIGKIQDKLRQLESGRINIVVLCGESVTVGLPDIQEAFKYIKEEMCHDPQKYKDLSGLVFTESAEVPLTDLWAFWLLNNENASRSLEPRLARKLKSLQK